jgi:hypothetical protein
MNEEQHIVSGTLELSNELCWMPAGWVFDGALERLALALQAERPSMSQALMGATTEGNGGYLDLRSADADELLALLRAAEEAYTRLASEGAASFANPEYIEGFVAQFQTLMEMIRHRLQGIDRKPRDSP